MDISISIYFFVDTSLKKICYPAHSIVFKRHLTDNFIALIEWITYPVDPTCP